MVVYIDWLKEFPAIMNRHSHIELLQHLQQRSVAKPITADWRHLPRASVTREHKIAVIVRKRSLEPSP